MSSRLLQYARTLQRQTLQSLLLLHTICLMSHKISIDFIGAHKLIELFDQYA